MGQVFTAMIASFYLAVLGLGVLLITYVPWLTEGLLRWMGRL